MSVYTYADYELVEVREQFEYRTAYSFVGGIYTQRKRRRITTKTWQATLTDALDDVPGSVDQGYPGAQNPGGLSELDGWRLYSVDYSRTQSQPFSKVVRETWVEEGAWQNIGADFSESSEG